MNLQGGRGAPSVPQPVKTSLGTQIIPSEQTGRSFPKETVLKLELSNYKLIRNETRFICVIDHFISCQHTCLAQEKSSQACRTTVIIVLAIVKVYKFHVSSVCTLPGVNIFFALIPFLTRVVLWQGIQS